MMQPGDKVTWLYTPRGGYGFVIPVNAEIVKVNPKTIRIKVQKTNGTIVERNVDPGNIKERTRPHA